MESYSLDTYVKFLGMIAHPEGGFYLETYRSDATISRDLGPTFPVGATRSLLTSIHYALRAGQKSALHKISSDELWAWHAGGPLVVVELAPGGVVIETIVGCDVKLGHKLTHVVPAGRWFGSYVPCDVKPGFSLVSCIVAPGFDFADWQMSDAGAIRDELCKTADPTYATSATSTAMLDSVLSYLAQGASQPLPRCLPPGFIHAT